MGIDMASFAEAVESGTMQGLQAIIDRAYQDIDPNRSTPKFEMKPFPGCFYHNYYKLGMSISFLVPKGTGRTPLDFIDFFNPPTISPPGRPTKQPWDGYDPPPLPMTFRFTSSTITLPPAKAGETGQEIERPLELQVERHTTGKEFVQCFGEPSKKGGGKFNIPLFLEWNMVELKSEVGGQVALGVMVELRDPGAGEKLSEEQMKKGAGGPWDRAVNWEWQGIKVFKAEAHA